MSSHADTIRHADFYIERLEAENQRLQKTLEIVEAKTRELNRALELIILRCDTGDPKVDWRPVIGNIARKAVRSNE